MKSERPTSGDRLVPADPKTTQRPFALIVGANAPASLSAPLGPFARSTTVVAPPARSRTNKWPLVVAAGSRFVAALAKASFEPEASKLGWPDAPFPTTPFGPRLANVVVFAAR